jgi:lipid-binding SYLF domain-containing protein
MKYAAKILLILGLLLALPAFAEDRHDVTNRLNKAADALNDLTQASDNGIPQQIMDGAKCIAIVPKLLKGGFIFGAENGRGVATCRVNGRWSAPVFFTITGGSWGAQIGVEGVELAMFFMNDEGARHLMSANWKIGADAGVAAGPYGRQATADTSWKLNTGILTYSRAKGAFIGVSLNGANVRDDEHANRLFYGRNYNFRGLLEGRVTPPQAARPFLASIHRDFREAEASK